jgi:hypothetical protein
MGRDVSVPEGRGSVRARGRAEKVSGRESASVGLDTNVVVSFIVQGDLEQAERARAFVENRGRENARHTTG